MMDLVDDMKKKLLITGDFDLPKQIDSQQLEVLHLRKISSLRELKEILPYVHGYILGGPEYISEDLFKIAKNLNVIILLGTGVASFIDENAADNFAVRVFNIPGINADAVSEFALGMMIVHNSNAFYSQRSMQDGLDWYQSPRKKFEDLHIGLVGMGNIGKSLFSRLKQIGCKNIVYHSRFEKSELFEQCGLKYLPLESLVSQSDMVVVQISYNCSSHHIFSEKIFKKFNREARLLCFSNPKIIDHEALKQALIKEQLRFAYMDGYYNEWIACNGQKKDPLGLLSLPADKFIATSHIAAQEKQAIKNMLDQALNKLEFIWKM